MRIKRVLMGLAISLLMVLGIYANNLDIASANAAKPRVFHCTDDPDGYSCFEKNGDCHKFQKSAGTEKCYKSNKSNRD